MTAHTIRLREPWDCEASEADAQRLSRRFNAPTGLDAHSRVSLIVGNVEAFRDIFLNGCPLEAAESKSGTGRWDITHCLQPRNQLVLVLSSSFHASGLEPLVRLEIEERESENSETELSS
jgi:hypothetical protein